MDESIDRAQPFSSPSILRFTLPLLVTSTVPLWIVPSTLTATSARKPGKSTQLARASRASARSLVASGLASGLYSANFTVKGYEPRVSVAVPTFVEASGGNVSVQYDRWTAYSLPASVPFFLIEWAARTPYTPFFVPFSSVTRPSLSDFFSTASSFPGTYSVTSAFASGLPSQNTLMAGPPFVSSNSTTSSLSETNFVSKNSVL